jgi:hypothetical protein
MRARPISAPIIAFDRGAAALSREASARLARETNQRRDGLDHLTRLYTDLGKMSMRIVCLVSDTFKHG